MKCKECGKDSKHVIHGLCRKCYSVSYYAKHRGVSLQYYDAHREERLQYQKEYHAAHGGKPASENRQCAAFLGVHVAEQVLSKVFKDVQKMPPNHKGYDFICIKDKKIDVKSACTHMHDTKSDRWGFAIRKNQIADYYLCLAFNNREDLNPLHIWLIPGDVINHLTYASISESTLSKWDEFKLDINKVTTCCDTLKNQNKL